MAVAEQKQRGAMRCTPKGNTKVFKTAVSKIHNLSRRTRAMLGDIMKRAHLAYERLLIRFMPNAAKIGRLTKMPKMQRRRELQATSHRKTVKATFNLPVTAELDSYLRTSLE